MNLVIPVGSTGISKTISAWLIPERGVASGSDANITAKGLMSALEQLSPVIELLSVSFLFTIRAPLLIIISLFHQTINITTKISTVTPAIINILFRSNFKNLKFIKITLIFDVWGRNGLNVRQVLIF